MTEVRSTVIFFWISAVLSSFFASHG